MARSTLSRRKMLQGIGACMALPFLEAMVPPGMDVAKYYDKIRPKRLAVFYFPNGVREDQWTPKGWGRDFELSPGKFAHTQ